MKLELKHISPYLPYGLKGNYLLSDVVPTTKDELRDKLLTLDSVKLFCTSFFWIADFFV